MRMKQAFSVLPLACLLPLQLIYATEPQEAAYTYEYGEDYDEPEDKEYSEEEQATALAILKDLYAEQIRIIGRVNNKETADAAVDLLHHQTDHLTPELLRALNHCDLKERIRIRDAFKRQFTTKHKELKQQLYFGSTLLARELSGSTAFAQPPSPMPEDLQHEIFEPTPHTDTEEDTDLLVTGGPGFTQETAWQLTLPPDKVAKEAIVDHITSALTVTPINKRHWDWNDPQLEVVFANGKVYYHLILDIYTSADAPDASRFELEQWYDISATYPFASEAEWQAEQERLIQNIQTLCEVLSHIQNKESAEASSAQTKAIVANIRSGYTAYYLLDGDSEQFQTFNAKAAPHFRKMSEEVTRIRRENFFGSETLQEVIKPEGNF